MAHPYVDASFHHESSPLADLPDPTNFLGILLETVPCPLFYKHEDGRYIGCNRAFCEFLKRPRDQIVGNTAYQIAPPALARVFDRMDQELLRQGGQQRYEYQVRSADGEPHHVIFQKACYEIPGTDPPLQGIVGAILDVTDLRLARQRLQQAHAEATQLIDAIPSILICLGSDDRVVRWNHAAQHILAIPSEDILGQPIREARINADTGPLFHAIEQCRQHRRQIELDNMSITRADGAERLLGITVFPICADQQGAPSLEILILAADVTERRALETQLRQGEKLQAIGELAAGIAHEINTPTQYIGDNLRFLEEAFGDLMKLLDACDTLAAQAYHVSELTDALACFQDARAQADLDYLRAEVGPSIRQSLEGIHSVAHIVRAMKEFAHPCTQSRNAVDINRAIENTLIVSKNQWKYIASVRTEFHPNLPLVYCYAADINQVMVNLLVNAADAISDAKETDPGRNGLITISTRLDDDRAEIRVADNGTGIPQDILSRIFDPFFTTKEIGKGSGQGLAIVRAVIVEKHGGELRVQSEPGEGATFTIHLPLGSPTDDETPEGLPHAEEYPLH